MTNKQYALTGVARKKAELLLILNGKHSKPLVESDLALWMKALTAVINRHREFVREMVDYSGRVVDGADNPYVGFWFNVTMADGRVFCYNLQLSYRCKGDEVEVNISDVHGAVVDAILLANDFRLQHWFTVPEIRKALLEHVS